MLVYIALLVSVEEHPEKFQRFLFLRFLSPMTASIEDVAKLANVSISTVSRVLNRKNVVNADTRRRVQAAIQELFYYHYHEGPDRDHAVARHDGVTEG